MPRSVRALRSRIRCAFSPIEFSTASVAILSFGEPTTHTCRPSPRNIAASSANWLGGQRLAAPNSAPGHRMTTGRSVLRCSARIAFARFTASGTSTGEGGIGTSAPRGTASAANRSTSRGFAFRSSGRASVSSP